MLTAERVRACNSPEDVVSLFAELGYPVAPVVIDKEQWRRASIDVAWEGELRLIARLRRFDLFIASGASSDDQARRFLTTYYSYNILIKSCVVIYDESTRYLALYDLSSKHRLRRLDIDLDHAAASSLDRLNKLQFDGESASLPRAFDLALDREHVARRFFHRFRDAVHNAARELAALHPAESGEAVSQQALLILSRLLFLCFVQKKGWLNGERRFLSTRLRECAGGSREFYAAVLTPLFFGCLNTPLAERDEDARRLGRIPYLNGGLFERSSFERRCGSLRLSNSLMEGVIEELFARFDFSTDETDEAGIHVDPEMLGKVFESLMEANERATTGSFYTPRSIVDALTSRAIADWLADGDESLRSRLGASVVDVDRNLALELLSRLERIAILDPACGSGAFLLSALATIERLTRALSNAAGREVPRGLRQRIVERSLFGVDIKPEAVRLCELRLWLAIVTTTDAEVEDIPPLPNLDRNILQGNSLLSPTDFLGADRADVYREWIYALRTQAELIARYRHAPREERPALSRVIRGNDRRLAIDLLNRSIEADSKELQRLTTPERDLFGRLRPLETERCAQLHSRISDNRAALQRAEEGRLDFFSFDVHFANVVAAGGFDLILGNPPWVRNARIAAAARRMYGERYQLFRSGGRRAAFHQPDLALAFVDRALSLIAPRGVVAMLLPAKVANAAYAAPLRRAVADLAVVAIDDWSVGARQQFDADTFPLGLTLARRAPAMTVVNDGSVSFAIEQNQISLDGPGSEWALAPPEVRAIVRRLRDHHPPLCEALGRAPVMGVKTGDNSLFFLGEVTVRGKIVITADGVHLPAAVVARCVRGRDVRRFRAHSSEWMLWPPHDGWRVRPRWLERFAESRHAEPQSFRLAFVRPEHVGTKVVWKDVSRGMAAAVVEPSETLGACEFPQVPNQTLYAIEANSMEEAYGIAALLNSSVVDALLVIVAERAKDAHFRYFGRTVGAIPLPVVDPASADAATLARLGRQAHQGRELTSDIDDLVASLYGVSEAELRTLRRFVAGRLSREAC